MSILVTGATGLVGNNVVRMLMAQNRVPRVLLRKLDAPPLYGMAVDRVQGDVTDPESLRRACQDMKQVIHCAGHVHLGWSGAAMHQAVNVEGTKNVAAAALAAGARMLHVSSVDALGLGTREHPADEETPPEGSVPCPYVLTKRAAEKELVAFIARGLDAVIVNPAYMLGPWDWKPSSGRMLLEVGKGFAMLAPPGGNDFCDVRDVAAGILAALERGQTGRRYILGGHARSYLEAWTEFATIIGVWKPKREAPPWLVNTAGKAGDLFYKLTGKERDVNSAAVAMSMLQHHYSSARAMAELGYTNRPLANTVRDAWEWFCARDYAKRRGQKSSP